MDLAVTTGWGPRSADCCATQVHACMLTIIRIAWTVRTLLDVVVVWTDRLTKSFEVGLELLLCDRVCDLTEDAVMVLHVECGAVDVQVLGEVVEAEPACDGQRNVTSSEM